MPPEENDTQAAPKMIEAEKFERVVVAKRGLESQVSTLTKEVQTLTERAATADTLAKRVQELESQVSAADGRFTRFTTIATAAGTTDPDVIEGVEWHYSKLPEADRPALPDWLGTLKADPSKAPTLLRSVFAAPEQQAEKPPPAKPKAPAGAGTQQPAGGAARSTPAELHAEAQKAAKTGDWTRYEQMRKA